MSARVLSLLFAGTLLFGCTQSNPSPEQNPTASGQQFLQVLENCNDDELCTLATLLASASSASQPNRNDGISVRNATTDKKSVTVSFDVPNSIADQPTRNGLTNKQQFTQSYKDGICDSEGAFRFFELGGTVRVVSFFPSGEKFSDEVVSSC